MKQHSHANLVPSTGETFLMNAKARNILKEDGQDSHKGSKHSGNHVQELSQQSTFAI